MRIAYVYDAVYPWVTGGVERRVYEISKRLAANHDVHWYGLQYWGAPADIEKDGVSFHGVGPPRELYTDGRRSIPQAMSFAASLLRPIRNDRFDIIDCQEFPYFPCFSAKFGSLRRETSLLLTWHEVWGDYWYEYLGRKGVFGKAVERVVAELPDNHVAVSERTRRDVLSLGPTTVDVVPNGIDRDRIAQVKPSEENIDALFVGRLIKEKNVHLFVDAINELQSSYPNFRGLILGDGPERQSLISQIKTLNLSEHIEIRSPLEKYEDVMALMKSADVFALPSRREGFGMVALEALACGTPVVTIRHKQNAAQELVTDGETGVICRPAPSSIATAIARARTEIDADDCIEATQPYDWRRIVEQLESIYHRVTNTE